MNDGPSPFPVLGPLSIWTRNILWLRQFDLNTDYAGGEVRETIGTSNAYTKPVGS
jgi:hypothetical protein